jgi:hypothetical protein
VATFNPLRHYGANEPRFRNYINLCLASKFRTMYSKRMKDALCCPGNFSLDGERADRCFVSGEPVPKQRRPYKKLRETSASELVG